MKHTLPIVIAILLSACNEDPELVRKQGEQAAKIAKLRGEIALMEERLKFLPPDKTHEVKEAKRETQKLQEEHKRLAEDLAELEEQRRNIQREYDEYKRKYIVR